MPYIITAVIILVLSYFLSRYDLLRYQSLVNYCCRADSHSDIVNHIITTNRFLPENYKIWTHETATFQDFYMDYRAWISDLYIRRSLSNVLTDYHSILAFRNRKLWNTKALSDILQGKLKEGMFLLETLDYYFYLREKDGITGKAPLYSCGASPEQDTLTDIGQVAYKIHLAALTARNIAGHHNDHEIENAQVLLSRSCPIPPD